MWVLVATIVGSSLVFIDGAVVTLALPQMQRTLGATSAQVTWVIESYTLMLGALMLLGGAIGDRYGRRLAFMTGTIVFGAGSLGCAFAPTIGTVIAARVLQGLGGMMLAPASLALIGAHFSGAERGRAIALWSSFGALTSSLGPALGGVIIDHWGWRAAFWINIPLIAVVLYATTTHVSESRDDEAQGDLDLIGAALCTLGLGAITFGLIESSTFGWMSARGGGVLVAGVAIFALFLVRERRASVPLLPLSIFSSTTFSGINIATLLLYGALGANFYEMPLVMIQGHGYSATQAAISTLPMIACLVLLSRFGARAAQRFGRRIVLTFGPTVVAIGFALLALLEPQGNYFVGFFPGMLLIGIGMGFTVAPLTSTAIDSVEGRHMGLASGINNAVSRIAGLLAIAGVAIVMTLGFNRALDAHLDSMHITAPQRQRIDEQRDRLGGMRVDPPLQSTVSDAMRHAYEPVAMGCAILALLAALVNATLIRNVDR